MADTDPRFDFDSASVDPTRRYSTSLNIMRNTMGRTRITVYDQDGRDPRARTRTATFVTCDEATVREMIAVLGEHLQALVEEREEEAERQKRIATMWDGVVLPTPQADEE